MAVFNVIGKIDLKGNLRPFCKTVEAATPNAAKEKAYALFGSANRLKRVKVRIEKVEKQ